MNDRPTAEELLEAVRKFLQDEAVPALAGHLSYQARVAANVVAIVGREIAAGDRHARAEWSRLNALLDDDAPFPETRDAAALALGERNRELVERIRSGEADAGPWRTALLDHLKRTTAEKLEVAKGSSG